MNLLRNFTMGLTNSFSLKNDKEEKKPENRKLILYGLLKIFHIFVIDMCYLNCGNPSIMFSILRDYSSDWEQFYKKVDSYVDEFYKHLDNCEDVKITIEKGSEKDTYAIKIELKRPTEEEIHDIRGANSGVVSEVVKKSRAELEIPTRDPFILINTELLMEIFNYCLYVKQFHQVLSLRKCLTSQLSKTCLALDPDQFSSIFNQCLTFDLPRLKSDDENSQQLHLDIKLEIEEEAHYVPVYNDDFLNSLKKKEEPIEVSGQESDDEELTSLKNNYEEEIAAAAKVRSEMPVFFNENLPNEKFSPAPRTIELEDEDDENSESQKKFRQDFEEQQRKFKAKIEAIREERRKKRMAHEAELKDLRRQQKQRFAALMSCIFLKQRFEEKESEWSSWIENSLRRLIVKVVRKFADFQDTIKSLSNFQKLLREDAEEMVSEIRDLHRAVLILLYDLEKIFNNLAKVDQDFDSVLFVRVIHKRVCEVSTSLIELLYLLEEIEYPDTWYQQLWEKMTEVTPSKIPSVSELKRICKNLNEGDYANLEFPKWESKSQVIIEELDDENDDIVRAETVEVARGEHRDELQEEVTEDDNCKIFEEVDEEDDEQVGTETVKYNGDEHHEKGKDGSSEDDKYEDQVQSFMLKKEVLEEANASQNDNESCSIPQYMKTSKTGFAVPKSGEYQPKNPHEPRNDTDIPEAYKWPCHSYKLETSTLGADYTGDQVTRPKESYTIGAETSFTNLCGIESGSSSIAQSTHPTETLTNEEKNDLNQNDCLEHLVETDTLEKAAFESNRCFTDQEVSKYMEPISQNEQSTVLPPRCGSVSPNLNDSPKSESGNLRGNETTEDALHFLKGLNQNLPDKPVSSRTRSASRPEIVKNSSVETKKSSKQEKVQSSGSFPVYTGSVLRHRFGSSRGSQNTENINRLFK
ncbi:unnamed protein product [Caenorhabditis brenneri]